MYNTEIRTELVGGLKAVRFQFSWIYADRLHIQGKRKRLCLNTENILKTFLKRYLEM